MPDFFDYQEGSSGDSVKLVVIGNSLTYTRVDPEEGRDFSCGLAASAPDKDFAHVLASLIHQQLPEKQMHTRVSNFSAFERSPQALNRNTVDSLIAFQPDFLVIQLTENCHPDSLPSFQEKCIELVNYFKERNNNCVAILTTPFYLSLPAATAVEYVALATNSFLVDLSLLTVLDPQNLAKNDKEYPGPKDWKNPGIGVHPGDYGMKNIAQRIFTAIQPNIDRHKN